MKWGNIKDAIERAGIRDDDEVAQINFLSKAYIDSLKQSTDVNKFHVIARGRLHFLHQVDDPDPSMQRGGEQ